MNDGVSKSESNESKNEKSIESRKTKSQMSPENDSKNAKREAEATMASSPENDSNSKQSKDTLPLSSTLVHERQSLQLCGIHTINNLLQISVENGGDEECMCGSTKLNKQAECWAPATKTELDEISDQLTIQENNLLVESDSSATATTTTPSFYQKLRSQHRTMVFGRYSFEVIQTALKRRHVELSWFAPDKNDASGLLSNTPTDDSLVIGFVVNIVNPKSLFARVPLFGGLFGDGRHWFAITRLQRQLASSQAEDASSSTTRWNVIDSLNDKIDTMDTNEALLELLVSISKNGGSIFRATIA